MQKNCICFVTQRKSIGIRTSYQILINTAMTKMCCLRHQISKSKNEKSILKLSLSQQVCGTSTKLIINPIWLNWTPTYHVQYNVIDQTTYARVFYALVFSENHVCLSLVDIATFSECSRRSYLIRETLRKKNTSKTLQGESDDNIIVNSQYYNV